MTKYRKIWRFFIFL